MHVPFQFAAFQFFPQMFKKPFFNIRFANRFIMTASAALEMLIASVVIIWTGDIPNKIMITFSTFQDRGKNINLTTGNTAGVSAG